MTGVMIVFFCIHRLTAQRTKLPNDKDITLHLIRKFFLKVT